MPTFLYTARDRSGAMQNGHLDAVNEDEVLTLLQNRGLIVTGISRKESQITQAAARRSARRLHGGVTADDQVMFCQQLATLLDAGVPLLKSLEVICAQVESRSLLVAVEQMRQEIEAGKTFHEAMAKHPKIFTKFWVNLVQNGEASGHLGQALNQLVSYLESVRDLQSKAMTALTYPLVLVVAAAIAVAIFVLKIIPVFMGIFSSMNLELPMLTQVIVAISRAAQKYGIFMAAGLFGLGWFIREFLRTDQGRWLMDRLLLRIPVFNQLFIQLQLAQFARGLGTLLDSGVPILFSLEIMEHGATNTVYGRAIGEVKEFVREGKTMAGPMEQTGLFPPMVVQMVQVGEEIGELDKMLDRIARYYEQRVRTFIERLSVLFEPIAIAVMTVVIGTLVVAMFLPIFQLAGGAPK